MCLLRECDGGFFPTLYLPAAVWKKKKKKKQTGLLWNKGSGADDVDVDGGVRVDLPPTQS